jgi:hypothetical protein
MYTRSILQDDQTALVAAGFPATPNIVAGNHAPTSDDNRYVFSHLSPSRTAP